MPIKEFIIKADGALPAGLEALCTQAFDTAVVAKARAKGAKLKLIPTIPWPKPPKKEKIVINDEFIARLKGMAGNEAEVAAELGKLNGPQVLQIGNVLGIPISKSAKVPSLRAQLLRSLRSEIVWMGIAGQGPKSGDPEVPTTPPNH
jgi:hypothetical protein